MKNLTFAEALRQIVDPKNENWYMSRPARRVELQWLDESREFNLRNGKDLTRDDLNADDWKVDWVPF